MGKNVLYVTNPITSLNIAILGEATDKTSKGNARRQQQHRKQQFQHSNKNAAAVETQVDNNSSSDDDFVFTVGHIGQASEDKRPKVSATIDKTIMKVLLDTGSSVNLLDRKQFEILNRHNKIALTKAQPKIYTHMEVSNLYQSRASLRPR